MQERSYRVIHLEDVVGSFTRSPYFFTAGLVGGLCFPQKLAYWPSVVYRSKQTWEVLEQKLPDIGGSMPEDSSSGCASK